MDTNLKIINYLNYQKYKQEVCTSDNLTVENVSVISLRLSWEYLLCFRKYYD